MFAKKGQAQGAATLIVIMTVLILLYVLMLPPADRADLLGEDPGNLPSNGYVYNQNLPAQAYVGKLTLMDEVPGTIDYTALNELEIPLSSFVLYKSVGSKILESYNSFYIKNGAGDVISKNVTFEIENVQNLNNVILTFKSKKHIGVLTISLNGDIIYQYQLDSTNPDPVKISKNALMDRNSLEFKVSGVGWQFWKTNEYSFEDIKIIADVTDSSRDQGENSFFISESQGNSIETATLRFSPDCQSDDVGKLTITLNGRSVFSAIPDCGSPNYVYFAPNMITIGKNKIEFKTDGGSYLLDLIKVRLEFADNQIPVYYFGADPGLFVTEFTDIQAECGKKDNYCPKSCDEDNDYDCCMTEYTTPFWCVADTANSDDKCVGAVVSDNLNRCPTNYIGRNGDVSDAGEDKCGDNDDNKCPSGCSIYNDEDCCFDVTGDQYWCEFMPTNGLNSRCVNSVSLGQCDICPSGYKGESKSPICKPSKTGYENNVLKQGYYVYLTMKFADNYQDKEADLYINGHLVRLQTDSDTYQRDISSLVEPDTNSIEIVPFSKLDIRSLKVDVVE